MIRASITVDQDKKDWLRHYADQQSSDEWTVLETYLSGKGSFDDFKEELISHYPEASNSLEGLIMHLDKLCAKSRPLMMDNLSVILEFIRGFKFEGCKLLTGGCISNREIVTKFLNCLELLNTELLRRSECQSTSDVDVRGAEFSGSDILQ